MSLYNFLNYGKTPYIQIFQGAASKKDQKFLGSGFRVSLASLKVWTETSHSIPK